MGIKIHYKYLSGLLDERKKNDDPDLKESKKELFNEYVKKNQNLIGLLAKREGGEVAGYTLEDLNGTFFEEQAEKLIGYLKEEMELDDHIKNLNDFRKRHNAIRINYNRGLKPNKGMSNEMESIRYTCNLYFQKHKLHRYLTYGGSTPQEHSEYNDFDSISDFDEILEGVIVKLMEQKA